MWHPVGELPAAVYWRRRLVVTAVLLGVLAGFSWVGVTLLSGRFSSDASDTSVGTSGKAAVPAPALERVVPSLTALRTPTPPLPAPVAKSVPAPTAAAPVAGGPCADGILGLVVRAPAAIDVGSRPTFQLVVQNTSGVPCVRPLHRALQEIVLLDGRGTRLWGSNDCLSGAGPDTRTLLPGVAVSFPLLWDGLTSEPTCSAARVPPAAGAYLLRGRLDTKRTPDLQIVLQ
ncbi:MAG: uncharacterized protein JWQ45_2082 [Blastococcus sp.]|nr:uncharacterized protein [Blastococcus sp.]